MGDELDPFGRRKDEDPLASLGWSGDETASTTEAQPQPARSAERAPPVASTQDTWRQPQPAPAPDQESRQRPPRQRERATAGTSAPGTSTPSPDLERLESVLRSQLGAVRVSASRGRSARSS